MPRRAGLDARVARVADDRHLVAGLEVEAGLDEEVGVVREPHEGRASVEEVRVLGARRQAVHLHGVPAHLARDRGEVGGRREHADGLRLLRGDGAREEERGGGGDRDSHGSGS